MQLMRYLVGVILPVGTIAAFTLLLVYSFLQLDSVQRAIRIEGTQNMLWVLSRAQSATLRLSEGAARHALGEDNREEVSRRLDIWFSTMEVLRDGPQQRQMESFGFAEALETMMASGPVLEATVMELLAGDRDKITEIHAILSPLEAGLSRAANQAMIAEWDELGARLDVTRTEMRQIGISLAAIAAAGLVLVIHLMVTARASAGHARLLKQERAFSELLVASSGKGIIAVDTQGCCTLWNEAMRPLFDLHPEQALGRDLRELAGFFDVERVRQALDAALAGESRTIPDQPLFRPEPVRPSWFDIEVFPLRDHSAIIGAILVITDVTERREAQRELARHRDHLEEEVARRTQELDAALNRERAALDIYRNFAAMVSHQFRTPLAIVDSSLQRMMRRGDRLGPEELSERGGKVRAAIARLVGLVESTLDAARLDAGQIEIRKQPCNLAAIVRDVIGQEVRLRSRIELTVREAMPPVAQGDPIQIEHILLNLLSNAGKYASGEAGIQVHVGSAGGYAFCRIVNDGRIPPEEKAYLFDRYFRGSNSRHASGIGIGLYMARSLARLQAGDVRLVDEECDRVAFELSLPLAETQTELPEKTA